MLRCDSVSPRTERATHALVLRWPQQMMCSWFQGSYKKSSNLQNHVLICKKKEAFLYFLHNFTIFCCSLSHLANLHSRFCAHLSCSVRPSGSCYHHLLETCFLQDLWPSSMGLRGSTSPLYIKSVDGLHILGTPGGRQSVS